MNNENNIQGAPVREIPVPPGGGSWTFDESKWEWVSNAPAPAEQVVTDDPVAAPEQPVALTVEE